MAAKNSAPTTSSSSLKEYLKKYESQAEEDKKKKKKKKNSKTRPEATAVLVVDEDPVWQKPVNVADENEDDSADEEKPQIEEDIEVKRMKRLEQLRLRRPYNAISEDGSGWIAVSETSKQNPNGGTDDADMSPPRKRTARSDTPPSPEEELKQPSVSGREGTDDLSPPRQRRARHSSPELDLSPPRQRQRRFDTPSVEPEGRASRSSVSNSDMSPPRRRARPSSPELDLSPPRQRRRRFDTPSVEPETRASRSSVSNSDMSPPRQPRQSSDTRRKNDMFDNLPPRPGRRSSPHLDLSPPRKSRKELSSSKEQPKTGLITGQDIKEVNAKTKKDDWLRFKEMDPAISGRGAEPVYRDKIKGERISKDEFAKSQKGEEKPKEKKLEWGKGLAQKREAEEKELELELEKDKPFARTRDDPELDKMLKERVRWGDPMAHLVKKSHSEALLRDLGDSEKMTESGFIIPQDVPNHSWLKRGLDAAPNRYGIKPGRHWDGVDRSNGFEKGFFKRTNEKQATQREAYLWSVADM